MPVQVGGVDLSTNFAVERLDALGGIGLEHAFALEQQKRGRGEAPDHVGLRVVLLRQQLGGHDAGRVAHPVDLDVGMGGIEALGIFLQVFRLDGRIDGQFGLGGGRGGARGPQQRGEGHAGGKPGQHECGHSRGPFRLGSRVVNRSLT
jgi:hypothetical protein